MSRALLTESERRAVRDDPEMASKERSVYLSRIEGRLDALATDAELLREHQPELYEQLVAAVVDEAAETDED